MIRFWLPEPPSANTLFMPRKGGKGRFKSRSYAEWIEHAIGCGFEQKLGRHAGKITGYYSFKLTLPAIRKDGDNCIKAAMDVCVSWNLVKDDRYCRRGQWEIDDTLPAGRCWVELEEMKA